MKVEQLNSTLTDAVHSNHSLSSYLLNLQRGREATPHSWLYENEASEDTLKRWIPLMRQGNEASPFGSEFNQFDELQLAKFGPQGKVPPIKSKEAMAVIEPLYTPSKYDSPDALSVYWPAAKEFATVLFGPRLRTKRRLSFESVVDDMRERDTLETNSGWPRFVRRDKVKDREIEDARLERCFTYPAIALFRQYNGKLRLVWMDPMSANLYGNCFAQLIQAELRRSPTDWVRKYLSPWEGYEAVKKTLTEQWTGDVRLFGGDTTAMDAHMRAAQEKLFFEIVKWLFQEQEWEDLWKSISYVNTIPLVISPDECIVGDHGLASGAEWTQLSETVLQLFMAWLDERVGQGIGDDFYWRNKPRQPATYYVDYMARFGLPAKPEKQSDEADSVTFLQRLNRRNFF